MHACMHAYIYIYIHTPTYIVIYVYTHMYIYIYIHTHTYIAQFICEPELITYLGETARVLLLKPYMRKLTLGGTGFGFGDYRL